MPVFSKFAVGVRMARIVFFGTPEYGVPVLEALVHHHKVVVVVTQPDRPAGRGRVLHVPPVKQAALAHGLEVLQPASLRREKTVIQRLCEARADVFVLAAFGQILRADLLAIPPHGCVGVHASLLPKYRGAAPVAAVLLAGESETGITLMDTDAGVDTGPIIAQRAIPIAPEDTSETLALKLSHLGAELLVEVLPAWLGGGIAARPQDEALASYAPALETAQGEIDWQRSALEIDRHIRAYTPWPGAYTRFNGVRLKLLRALPLPDCGQAGAPGTVAQNDAGGVGVVTGEGLLLLEEIQLAGKRATDAQAFARGQRHFVGSTLG